ncbi:Uncharacterized protein dnm_045780 [Desulfonema magnum]|uniref:Uncharacterized protein n=1 Tax=Desulfonema magnum TaxID=45655 RepID=A0A975BNJ3_9BACT|nr:Uncharacterized protein dnm_045780 [Desulfonema magnum]
MLKLSCHRTPSSPDVIPGKTGAMCGNATKARRREVSQRIPASLCVPVSLRHCLFGQKKIARGPASENITIFRNGGALP